MKINNIIYSNPKQAVLPMLIQDYDEVNELSVEMKKTVPKEK